MQQGTVVFGHAHRTLLTADQREIPLAEAAAPLFDRDGKIRGAVVSFWDRTKEHQSEVAKLDFLMQVSHELRNSLTGVLSMAELLREPRLPTATRDRAIHIVADHVERLKSFAQELLEFETEKFKGAEEDKELNLGPLLRRMIEEKKLGHPDRSFALSVRGGRVYADAGRLETVLINLLDNAAKFSPPGSTISITPRIVNKTELGVAIHNVGAPIPPDEQAKIFERGYRAQLDRARPVEGSGIGLWLVRGKLHEMGGEISVKSDATGTTFFVMLRRAGGKNGKANKANKTSRAHSRGRRRQTGRGRTRRHS
jgi:two-component system sensor histidine kinase ResE